MPEKKREKQNLILDAAFELILEKGYSNTKIIDIANKAGIGKGTFYEYFESKEALALELVNTRVRNDYVRIHEEIENEPTSTKKLAKYLQLEIEATSKYRANVVDFRNEFMGGGTEISEKVLAAVHSIMQFQFESVYNIIKAGIGSGEFKNVDPFAAAACFMGSIGFYMSLLHFSGSSVKAGGPRQAGRADDAAGVLDCLLTGLIAH